MCTSSRLVPRAQTAWTGLLPSLLTHVHVPAEAHGLLFLTTHVMTATAQVVVVAHSGSAVEAQMRGSRLFRRTTAWSGVPAELATAEWDHIHSLLDKYSATSAAVLAVITIDDGPAAPAPASPVL